MSGAQSATFKHGKYTEVIPSRVMEWYLEFRRDPNLMDMTDDIGLLQARQKEILGGLSTGEAGASWRRMAELIQALKAAMSARDSEGIVSALTQLETLARNGASDVQVWNEYMNVGEKKRRLVETERKRRMDMKVMLAPEQLMAILRGYTQIVMEETNPDDLDRIARRMFALSQRVKAGDLDAAMSPQ